MRGCAACGTVFAIVWLALPVPLHAQGPEARIVDGRELYLSACAACHGPDGRGMPKSVVGFDVPLPDFTDCSFATPETDADWLAVAHSGGPVRAFDRMMPAFGEALSEEEILRTIAHIRTFCRSPGWPRGELNLPRPLVTEKAFPENEAVMTMTIDPGALASVNTRFVYERRIGARTHWELAVPIGLRESDGAWHRGLGDVAIAVKRVLYDSLPRGWIVSFGSELALPTGKENLGLGSGTTLFEPYLAYGQILPHDSFLQVHGGFELSANRGRAEHEVFWRAALGRSCPEPGFGRVWSPMIELLAARELRRGDRLDWDLVPQLQVTLSRRQHVMINGGVRIPANQRTGRSTRIMVYLLWDWFDGGLFEGWR